MALQNQVFIVGGGPAGLAAAISLRNKGFPVKVADAGRPPIEKVCGEGLLPETLTALEQLGVRFAAGEGRPFAGIRYIGKEHSVGADFMQGAGLGMRRLALHQKLIRAASEAGAEFLWNTCVERIGPDGVYASSKLMPARWIIGADGAGSRVRKWLGIRARHFPRVRYSFRRHYACAAWSKHVEVYWGKSSQFYVTPVGSDEICVVVISRYAALRIDEALQEFPVLAARLAGVECTSPEKGAATANRCYREVCRGNVLLIGDASGMVDAITGEGLGLAFRQSLVLADALAEENPELYRQAHKRLRRRSANMARLMLTLDGRPWLQGRVLRAFAAEPSAFRALLATHTGRGSLRETAMAGIQLARGIAGV
jgi:2-polyprenyl-6-methoxyphenol hydroxylase-like FAD-dependent oxidoreductase